MNYRIEYRFRLNGREPWSDWRPAELTLPSWLEDLMAATLPGDEEGLGDWQPVTVAIRHRNLVVREYRTVVTE